MKRRRFFKICAVGAGCIAAPTAIWPAGPVRAEARARSLLVHEGGEPVAASDLATGVNYIFHYPYISTPCFLLRLSTTPEPRQLTTRDGESYRWDGGVGPGGTVVAFSAICAHRMAHPSRQVNHISFRPDETAFGSGNGVIACCAENSVYDPAAGARVLGGPAPEPLAAILLDYNEEDDSLYASGVVGGDMFHRFFDEYGARLGIEYLAEPGGFAAAAAETTVVQRLDTFTAQTITCGVDPDSDDPGVLGRD